MKKILLAAAFAATSLAANAQLTLSGTSYYQNFNGIGSGLPTGWAVADTARVNYLGDILPGSAFISAATSGTWGSTTNSSRGGFKNYPSANVITMGADSLTQVGTTDRALGVRQVNNTASTLPNSDPGAAFILQIANTTGFKNFTASFKLQSLDTAAPRVTTWRVDYGFGATPTTFTAATATTSGSLTTGGHVFKNDSVSINFDTVLNNKSTNVWIRIVAVDTSAGSGARAVSCIDDFRLNWAPITVTGINDVTGTGSALRVLGAATANTINLAYAAPEAGDYKLVIADLNGRVVYTSGLPLTTGDHSLPLRGLNLAQGMYVANISNGNTTATAKIVVQ
ncbi:MAG: T9SS type A sorting domain-containing protein [Chitinophagaceae bacterium]|nr:T9SS type A sorting domain-containing protein [Chitinophagaceae bacterium]